MRNYEQEFTDTCKLMRNYMEQNRPQSFASVWNLILYKLERKKNYVYKD